jgi:hypothetical protein
VIIAHIGGVPFEEWLAPLAAGGSGIFLAVRATLGRLRPRRESQVGDPAHSTGAGEPIVKSSP